MRRRIHSTARLMPAPVVGNVPVPITAHVEAASIENVWVLAWVSTPTTCAYCSATTVICLLLSEEIRSEPAGRITLRQITNGTRSTTGAKRTAFYQAIGVGRLLPGPPGGQAVYKTPQGGSDMKGVTPGGPGKQSANQPRAGHYPLEICSVVGRS